MIISEDLGFSHVPTACKSVKKKTEIKLKKMEREYLYPQSLD